MAKKAAKKKKATGSKIPPRPRHVRRRARQFRTVGSITIEDGYQERREFHLRVPKAKEAAAKLRKVDGVDYVEIGVDYRREQDERYGLNVNKGVAFTWEDVEPRVLEVLEKLS